MTRRSHRSYGAEPLPAAPGRLTRALVLGLLQGVTEVLPVSSSAHLTAVPWLLGWPPPGHRTAAAATLHAGSCAGIAAALLGGRERPPAVRLLVAAATSGPAAVAGLRAADAVEARLGRPAQLAALLAVAGAALAAADLRPADQPAVRPGPAAAAALAQVAALAPGVSRSGAALTALRLARVERGAAQEFSLLMSLPVTAGAAGLSLLRTDRAGLEAPALAVGTVTAGAAAFALTRATRAWAVRVDRRGSHVFFTLGLYRLLLAAVLAATLQRRRGRRRPPGEETR